MLTKYKGSQYRRQRSSLTERGESRAACSCLSECHCELSPKLFPYYEVSLYADWSTGYYTLFLQQGAGKYEDSEVKVVVYEGEADNSGKITIAIRYRYKKRCTNCQDHGDMKPLLKQKLKDRLQRTRQSARNKESRTLGLEAIGKLFRHGRIIYYLFIYLVTHKSLYNMNKSC